MRQINDLLKSDISRIALVIQEKSGVFTFHKKIILSTCKSLAFHMNFAKIAS